MTLAALALAITALALLAAFPERVPARVAVVDPSRGLCDPAEYQEEEN